MSRHIDLVKNEWGAGTQVRLASASSEDHRFVLSHVLPGYEELLRRPVRDVYGEAIYPEKEPERAIEELPRFYSGSYVFATSLHEETECPFRNGAVVPMQSVELKF